MDGKGDNLHDQETLSHIEIFHYRVCLFNVTERAPTSYGNLTKICITAEECYSILRLGLGLVAKSFSEMTPISNINPQEVDWYHLPLK